MTALQGWWLASRRTYCEGWLRVRACAGGKTGRQVVMHIRPPLNVASSSQIRSQDESSGSGQSQSYFSACQLAEV